jgi:hypothetical protein
MKRVSGSETHAAGKNAETARRRIAWLVSLHKELNK